MSDEKVSSLFGGAVITGDKEPDPDLVEELENLLEAAKAGEIIGLAGAILYFDKTTSTRCVGTVNRATLGALMITQHGLIHLFKE